MIPVFVRRGGGEGAGEVLRLSLERLNRLDLRLHAGEEAILHHLRRAGDQALTEAGDRAAGLRRAVDVNDRVGAAALRDNSRSVIGASPFTNPGRPWPSTASDTTGGSTFSRDHHRAFVVAGDRRHADRDGGLVAIGAVRLEALTSRDARRDRGGIHHQRPRRVSGGAAKV